MRFTSVDLPVPVPPTMATNCPGSTVRSMPWSTSSPLPEALYLKLTPLNSTLPRLSGRARPRLSGESAMSGSASSTSTTRLAQATARVSISRQTPTMSTLISTCTM